MRTLLRSPMPRAILLHPNDGGLTTSGRRLVRSRRGTRDLGVLDVWDPAPALVLARQVAARAVARLRRRRGPR